MRILPRVAIGIVLLAAPLTAQDSVFTDRKFMEVEGVAGAQISPDGQRIVFSRLWIDQMKDRRASMLWLMDADGGRPRELLEGGGARWSPDGSRIAYLADAEGKTQLWIRYMDAEGLKIQVTRGLNSPKDFRWSPDGKQLAFTMFVDEPMAWSVALPSAPAGGKWTDAPRMVDRYHFRGDGIGYYGNGHQQLFVVSADGGTPRQLTRGSWDVGSKFDGIPAPAGIDWLPDGRTIVFDGDDDSDADRHFTVANLYTVDVASGAIRKLTGAPGYWHAPVVSPDGKWIAYGGISKSSNSYQAEDLWVIHPDGSGARAVTTGFDRDPINTSWSGDSQLLWFSASDHGTSNVYSVALAGGGVKAASNGQHFVNLSGISNKGGFGIATRSAPQQPQELVRFSLKKAWDFQPLTHLNDDLLAGMRLGEVEEVEYHSGDQLVQGWLVKPPGFNPSQHYPLILEIHGGPHSMYNVGFNPSFQHFAAKGYLVLYTNPRGSTGYGTTFGNAIAKAYPSVDYDDLMAGVDEVIKRGWVDTTRMFVGGCSGGGVLSSWTIGHTTRFAAAAVRCPVINWLSFAGQTDVPMFGNHFFDKPFWEDPLPYLKTSPLMYVGNVKTPTLLMTGELDLRTPIAQTEEYYSALKLRGVPTVMLRFAGEYHGTASKPSNAIRTQLYMLAWYEKYSPRQ
ncbi:MAG: S9 family peptidase [Gemmatimonadota bacterium]